MRALTILGLCTSLFLAGCKFVPTASKDEAGNGGPAKFDPDAQVAAIWQAKLIPYLEAKAGPFPEVQAAAAANPDEAGKKYGYKEKGGVSPWTVVVRLEGKVVTANTQSRAGTIDVDADGDGKVDAQVQIGPVMRGTAIRDSLDFVSFNQFTNQIDFAQFGKAFNLYTDKTLTSKLPRDKLAGQNVKLLGVYPLVAPGTLPLVTPAEIALVAPK